MCHPPSQVRTPSRRRGGHARLSAMSGPEHPETSRISARTVVLTAASVVLALVLLGWGLPAVTGTSWRRIAEVVAAAPAGALALLPVLALVALGAGALGLSAAVAGLPRRDAVPLSALSTAVSVTVPGGSTLALGLLYAAGRRRGVGAAALVVGVALITAADLGAGLLLAPAGALGYALSGSGALGGGAVAAVWVLAALSAAALVAGVLLVRRRTLAALLTGVLDGLGALLGARGSSWSSATVLARRDEAALRLRAHTPGILLPPLVVRACQFAALVVALDAVGLEVPLPLAVAVFALGRLLALIPLTPGGTGIAETGSAAALIALGFDAGAAASAAVLVSVTTLLTPLALGLLALALRPLARGR